MSANDNELTAMELVKQWLDRELGAIIAAAKAGEIDPDQEHAAMLAVLEKTRQLPRTGTVDEIRAALARI